MFIELGPKKALHGFAEDVLGMHEDVLPLFTNHPKFGDIVSLNQALCGLYAAGLGTGEERDSRVTAQVAVSPTPVPSTVAPVANTSLPNASGT